MVYRFKRGRSYRRKYVRRKGRVSRPTGIARYAPMAARAWNIGKKAFFMVRKLKSLVNVEHKYFVATGSAQNIDYSGGYATLNGVSQGDTDQTRDGDSLKILSAQLNCIIKNGGADANVRVMLIWDKQNITTAASDILEATGSATAPQSYKKWDTRFATNVLFDSGIIPVRNGGDTDTKVIQINVPLYRHTQYLSGTTSIRSGALKILYISDINVSVPTIDYYSRIVFVDN